MLRYWIWLSSRPGIGGKTAGRLLDYFGSPESVYFAREDEYTEVDGLTGGDRKTLSDKSLKSARKTLELCEENGYRILTLQDAEYPARLKNIFDPPVLLYIWGHLPVIDEEAAVAIVGTRNCTAYGQKSAERIGYEIASRGSCVSGLARDDTAAAKGALPCGRKSECRFGSGWTSSILPNKRCFRMWRTRCRDQ
jgi:DNA processing protein